MPKLHTTFIKQLVVCGLATSLAVLTISCQNELPTKNTKSYKEAISAFYVGLAATQVGNDQRAALEMNRAAELASAEPAIWNNLGVLQLRQKNPEQALQSLRTARDLAPDKEEIYFNLAILARQNGDSAALFENLNKAREINPKNLQALYLLATEREKLREDSTAIKEIDQILRVEPGNTAALIEAARLYAKTQDKEKAADAIEKLAKDSPSWSKESREQFAKLRSAPFENTGKEIAFLRNVLLREPGFRAAIAKIKPSDTTLGVLIVRPLKLAVPDFSPAEPDMAIKFTGEKVADNALTTIPLYQNGEDPPIYAYSTESQLRIGDSNLDLKVTKSNEIAVLDFDYDFRNDFAYAGADGFKLFRQSDQNNYEDVTSKTGIVIEGKPSGVWAFDFDNEGDLDLFVGLSDGEAKVYQNNGNGTFTLTTALSGVTGVSDFLFADIDEDGDGDAVILTNEGEVSIFYNERGGLYRAPDKPKIDGVAALAVGDTDGSGTLHLAFLLETGTISRAAFDDRTYEPVKTGLGKCSGQCEIEIADLDNNGANDFVVSDGSKTTLLLGGKDGKFAAASTSIDTPISGIADLNEDGKLDLLATNAKGQSFVYKNETSKDYNWQVLRPKAAKTEGDQRVNTFGIGGEIEIRAGLLVQKQLITSPRVHFGLGNNAQADVARIIWQNGYVQAEFDIKTNQVIAAEQRLKGSCPHVFAWNGTEFAHVKDAPPWSPALGLKINAQDTYGILQTEEWFKIPGESLKPKDGFYELRITGEYWESFYIDSYSLMAVDHPEEISVFTDERFAIPLPPLKVFSTEEPKSFASATDHNGNNVSETVQKLDQKYLDDIKRGKYQGVAEDHFVELELPASAPLDQKIWIIADGWVHPTDASINVQRGQDVSRPPKSLSIEIQDNDGNWKTAKENLGFPAGKMKTVLLDLEGIFEGNENKRRLRLRTEMEIFWDKLSWAVDNNGTRNETKTLDMESAELRYRGFSLINKADDSSPEVPDYNTVITTGQRWRDLEGYYTRFGDIKELLEKTDDRFVLSSAGDELVLKFPALPAVKKGYKRDFVIIGNGWIKDGDLNSVYSKTLLPLPTQSSNDYSRRPTTLEEDPVYQKNSKDWVDFHTRYVAPDAFRKALRDQ
jgi:tetratricopeptide (TPR) repeat protein